MAPRGAFSGHVIMRNSHGFVSAFPHGLHTEHAHATGMATSGHFPARPATPAAGTRQPATLPHGRLGRFRGGNVWSPLNRLHDARFCKTHLPYSHRWFSTHTSRDGGDSYCPQISSLTKQNSGCSWLICS